MLGIDVVDIERFRAVLTRCPRMPDRFFTAIERAHCRETSDPALHLAGTLAAKEAVMKAMGLTPAPAWARRIEVSHSPTGAPVATVEGTEISVSLSHDAGVAVAVALGERE